MTCSTIGHNSKKLFWRLCILYALSTAVPVSLAQNAPNSAPTPRAAPSAARLGPALDPAARRQAMIGRWYGESKTSDGRILRWITERENSGTYRTEYFLGPAAGETDHEESIELGQWGLSGSIFFTIQRAWAKNGETQRADPGNVYSYDAYELISINERIIEYVSAGSAKRFLVRRVTPDFQLNPRPFR